MVTLLGGSVVGLLIFGVKRELSRFGKGQEELLQQQTLLVSKFEVAITRVHARIDTIEQEFYMLKGEHNILHRKMEKDEAV